MPGQVRVVFGYRSERLAIILWLDVIGFSIGCKNYFSSAVCIDVSKFIVNECAYFFIRKFVRHFSIPGICVWESKSALFFIEVLFEVLYFVVEAVRICLESPRLFQLLRSRRSPEILVSEVFQCVWLEQSGLDQKRIINHQWIPLVWSGLVLISVCSFGFSLSNNTRHR